LDRGLSVIVVENNRVVREIVHDVLYDLDIDDVSYANNAHQGLEEFAQRRRDLVILEVAEDSGDGLHMLETIRDSGEAPDTAFVMLSAHPTREIVMRAGKAGADALVVEPMTSQTMADHIFAAKEKHPKSRVVSKAQSNQAEPPLQRMSV
jgi:DNA-binding NarL/FixJ family response regulator